MQWLKQKWLEQKRFGKRLQLVLTILLDAQHVLNAKKKSNQRDQPVVNCPGRTEKQLTFFIDFLLPEKNNFVCNFFCVPAFWFYWAFKQVRRTPEKKTDFKFDDFSKNAVARNFGPKKQLFDPIKSFEEKIDIFCFNWAFFFVALSCSLAGVFVGKIWDPYLQYSKHEKVRKIAKNRFFLFFSCFPAVFSPHSSLGYQ